MRKIASSAVILAVLSFFCGKVFPQHAEYWSLLVNAEELWSYFPGTREPPSDWVALGFNVDGWEKGPGGIGWGDGDDRTVISRVPSVYLRQTFQVEDPGTVVSAFLFVDYDDGFVAYLNGIEIARANMGSGYRPPYNQYAVNCNAEAQLPSGGVPARFLLLPEHLAILQKGDNVLALQVHDCNATSSDLSSTAYLAAGFSTQPPSTVPLPAWMPDPSAEKSHLPIIIIDTYGQQIPDEPKINVAFRIIDNGPGMINSPYDAPNHFNGTAGIEVRGQSSQMFPKKSYGLELRDSQGEEVKAELLGMPGESDWILYAPYTDKTMLRNAITFYLGGRMGRYQPRFRFCELYLNGNYHGVYQLTERIKRDKDRVDIEKLETTDTTGDAVTGGYIVKVDKIEGLTASDYFISYPDITFPNSRAYRWSWYVPKARDLNDQQKNYFKGFIKTAETALNSSSFTSLQNGYPRYFDTGSFIDFQIINEIANNVDGYRYSTFFFKDRDSKGGKLVAGPLWDFDLCYGNVDYAPERYATNTWLYASYGTGEGNCMHWWYRLMQDPAYASALKQRYSILRQGILSNDTIMTWIDSNVTLLGDAVDRNFTRWPILGQYVWPNSAIRYSYDAEITFLKEWITNRLNWMDSRWLVPVSTTSPTQQTSLSLSLFPNPFRETFHIVTSTACDEFSLEVTDVRGITVFSLSGIKPSSGSVPVSLPGVSDGVYFLKVTDGKTRPVVSKIVKKQEF